MTFASFRRGPVVTAPRDLFEHLDAAVDRRHGQHDLVSRAGGGAGRLLLEGARAERSQLGRAGDREFGDGAAAEDGLGHHQPAVLDTQGSGVGHDAGVQARCQARAEVAAVGVVRQQDDGRLDDAHGLARGGEQPVGRRWRRAAVLGDQYAVGAVLAGPGTGGELAGNEHGDGLVAKVVGESARGVRPPRSAAGDGS